jgi:hypothetical protein
MMARYAENTDVPAEKSRMEIERTLQRYGADGFMYGWADENAVLGFRAQSRHVKFVLPMPDREAKAITHVVRRGNWCLRTPGQQKSAYDQAMRQRWRALCLVIKAKLEAVEAGITCFEDEFMAHIVLPNGQTVGNWMRPQIEASYKEGGMPPLLMAPH